MKVLVEVSNRHVHLSEKHVKTLFGELHLKKDLSQPGQFAAEETVNLINGERIIKNVRILGPGRDQTQVEISTTDAINLKIEPILRMSGDLKNTPGITIEGPNGKIKLNEGVIIAQRHLHTTPKDATKMSLKNNQKISVDVGSVIFKNVVVRISENYKTAVHLDTDEGNAAGIKFNAKGTIIN
jgi:putative phosphotransacetylase